MDKPSRSARLALILITAAALWLRLAGDDGPFDFCDEIQIPSYVLDSIPQGGWLASLFRIDHVALGNPLRLIAFPLSAVLPVVGFVLALVCRVLSIPLTESTWSWASAIPGALTIPAVYALLQSIAGRRAALWSAALLAVTPLHVMLSRSLAAAWSVAFLLEVVVILCVRRLVEGRTHAGLWLGLALAAYIPSHNQFPSIAPVVLVAAVALDPAADGLKTKLSRALRRLAAPAVVVPPLLALLALIAIHLAFDVWFVPHYRVPLARGTGVLGHMLSRGTDPGFYGDTVLAEARTTLGTPLVILVCAGVALAFAAAPRAALAILLAWSAGYLGPFLFLILPGKTVTKGYQGDGLYPLVLLTGVTLAILAGRATRVRHLARAALVLAIAVGAATSWATIRQAEWAGPLRLPRFHGCVRPDAGIKAGAVWLREHAPDTARILAISVEPKLVRYYARRFTFGVASIPPGGWSGPFAGELRGFDYVVLPAYNLSRAAPPGFAVAATVRDGDKDLLHVLARSPGRAPPVVVDLAKANARFDREFALFDGLWPQPDYGYGFGWGPAASAQAGVSPEPGR